MRQRATLGNAFALTLCLCGASAKAVSPPKEKTFAAAARTLLSVDDGKPLALPDSLSRNGVESDVVVHTARFGGADTGLLRRLFGPRPHFVAIASTAGGDAEVLADRKAFKSPAVSRWPALKYGVSLTNRRGALALEPILTWGADVVLAGTVATGSHKAVAVAAAVDVAALVLPKFFIAYEMWRSRAEIRGQSEAVGKTAKFVLDEGATGKPVAFTQAYAFYREALGGTSAPLDAFRFRDWLGRSVTRLEQPRARHR